MIRRLFILFVITAFMLYSCSRKHHPSKAVVNTDSATIKKSIDSLNTAKAGVKKKVKVPIPKMIEVNDSAAHKSVDGRLYYDVMGHRYWKNYKDGKYYLFNQSIYNNDDFKPK